MTFDVDLYGGEGVRCLDCLDPSRGLPAIPDDAFDVILTDSPYDEHTHKKGRRGQSITAKPGAKEPRAAAERAAFSRSRELGFEALTLEQMTVLAVHYARTCRRWIGIFCAVEMIGAAWGTTRVITGWRSALEAAGLDYVRTAFWRKIGATPQFTGDRPAQAVEAIVLAHRKGRKKWNGGGKHGWYDAAFADADACATHLYEEPIVQSRGSEQRLHTTQKPLELMLSLVRDFTFEGDLVCDPFTGSGTTGLACKMLGRRFIGWEVDETYAAIAQRRIAGEAPIPDRSQPSLFGDRS
jgi:site-specific DNA-methyltransferase (adenine-specific)